MALGAITVNATIDGSKPVFFDDISFAGDGAYVAGGTPFKALLRAKTVDQREPRALIPIGACGGYTIKYDFANDKLQIFRTDQVDDPEEEVPNGNYSSTTFRVLVISQ